MTAPHDDCAALRLKCAALEAALGKLESEALLQCGNEEGEDYVQCNECDGQQWGSRDTYDAGDIDHAAECPFSALSGEPTALREMLMEAALGGWSSVPWAMRPDDAKHDYCAEVVERILGINGGGE